MGKTTQVAADRAYDQSKTVLPAEVAQGVYMQHAPSLAALKLMHLMIGTAGGRMADDVRHEFRLSAIKKIDGMDNHTRKSIVPLFQELAAAVLTVDDPIKMTTTIGGLMPLLFERSIQAQFLIPMAITIVFGLGMATLLILFVVPSLIASLDDLGKKFSAMKLSR